MELIELVANNQYMFTSDRNMKRGVMEVDTMDALLTQNKAMAQQLTTLNKKLEKLEVSAMGWGGNQNPKNNNFQQGPPYPPFQRPPFQPPFPQQSIIPNAPQPKPTSSTSFEAILEKLTFTTAGFVQSTNNFIEEARANFRNQESLIRNLKTQLGQIAKQLSTTLPNAFPSNIEDNPKGEYKEITLGSGIALEDVSKKVNVQPTMENGKEEATREAKL
ncbi:hypothetical protein PIB30_084926 [Stylosanthes scabra]|uniref:Uncharacterized protein n=1 Tax=Stylosanthes scabra TaxID=79078 RepID=A0ABU6ST94_9FABA|nr:hypothetical protein [Stylosanthes scabra]